MSDQLPIRRRDALKMTAAGFAAALASPAPATPRPGEEWPVKPSRDPFRGLKVGITSYTTRKLSLDATIAALRRLDIKYISIKSYHLALDSTPDERKAVARKIADAGLTMMGCGVIGLENDEAEIRRAFDYCQDAGASTAIIAPTPGALPAIDRIIKDYKDFRVAIHNHGPGDDNFPSPASVYEAVKSLDPRIGLCVDVGHTFRLAEDPVAALRAVRSRLYDVHLKDFSEAAARSQTVPLGRGRIDVNEILKTLLGQKYSHHVALEWEGDAEDPIPGMSESFGYVRGVLSAI